MPRRKLPSGTKIKRLTLYPQKIVKSEKSEAPEVSEAPEAKPKGEWRWVPTKERPDLKAPGKLPYYKESPPRYEEPAPPPPPEVSAPADNNNWVFISIAIIVIAIVFAVLIGGTDDNGGGGGGSSGPRRGCIADPRGSGFLAERDPGCDDGRGGDGTCKETLLNNRSIGNCTYVRRTDPVRGIDRCIPC